GDDPHPHHTAVRDVLELRLRLLVDVVRRFGRGHLDQERVDVLICERLPAHLPRLTVFDHRDRLVRKEIELIPALAAQDVDEWIDPGGHQGDLRSGGARTGRTPGSRSGSRRDSTPRRRLPGTRSSNRAAARAAPAARRSPSRPAWSPPPAPPPRPASAPPRDGPGR